ncbi:hypothetical protein IV102_22165 [bacterium]|nr:hypothetical protein [bacterium]
MQDATLAYFNDPANRLAVVATLEGRPLSLPPEVDLERLRELADSRENFLARLHQLAQQPTPAQTDPTAAFLADPANQLTVMCAVHTDVPLAMPAGVDRDRLRLLAKGLAYRQEHAAS